MLRELKVTQPEDEWPRRWFADEYFDLIVWLSGDSSIHGFQLCYDKGGDEHALTWTEDRGYTHNRVDTGEDVPTQNRTPILVEDGAFASNEILARFDAQSLEIDREVRDLVMEKLRDFPG